MPLWLDRAASIGASTFIGLFLGGALTVVLPFAGVIAAGSLVFGFGVCIDIAMGGRPWRSFLAIAAATLVVAEAYVHPPTEFMDVTVGSFADEPLFRELLSKSNLHCFRCDEYLDTRIPVPVGRDLMRWEVVEAVKAALPMTSTSVTAELE